MKKLLLFAVAALFLMGTSAYAEDICFPCNDKDPCYVVWDCPTFQISCEYIESLCDIHFKICNCLDADEFKAGAVIGITYTSITEGAYFYPVRHWAPNLWLTEGDDPPYCYTNYLGARNMNTLPSMRGNGGSDSYTAGGESIKSAIDGGTLPQGFINMYNNNLGGPGYWDVVYEGPNSLYPSDGSDWSDVATDKAKALKNCDVPSDIKYTSISTIARDNDNDWVKWGYVVVPMDQDYIWWSYTMPAMFFDWEEIQDYAGLYAQVKVELFLVDPSGVICSDCDIVCECIIDAVRICGKKNYDLMFPYVLNEETGWSTGLAVSNVLTNVTIGDMSATFMYIDSEGEVFTYTKDDFDSQVWSATFEMLADEAGWDCAPGSGVLWVMPNFEADGYEFNFAQVPSGVFGAGNLPRIMDDNAGYNYLFD